MTNETDSLLGAVVGGRWRITRKLGEGGMGAVYCAEGTAGEGEFAIKVLHREFVKEEQVVSRFYAEAEASKRLQHPHIARVFESGTAESGEPYLLMELLRGQPLGDACPEGSRLPAAQVIPIMREVLLALEEAHRQDIVHRDLKPDNIFLCDQGDRRIAKLLDFGIARVIDAASGGAMRKTKTGMLLGTPGYMSPEQLRNSKSVDPRSDLWSLSTVFYEMLSGRDPYGATNDFARLTAVFTQESIPIDRDVPELAPWREFFQRAFMRDINQRFQSAPDMARCIEAVASGQPLPPPAPPLDQPAPQPSVPQAPPVTPARPHTAEQMAAALASTQVGTFTTPAGLSTAPTGQSPVFSGPASLPGSTPAIAAPPSTTPQPSSPSLSPGSTGSSKLVWGLITVVLILGAVIAGLAIKSMQDDKKERRNGNGDGQPSATAPATATTKPATPSKKK